MSTRADAERQDREYAGLEDHWSDGDWSDDADRAEPEPLPSAPEPERIVGAVCGRWLIKRRHGASWHPCTGRVTADGGCTEGCVPR